MCRLVGGSVRVGGCVGGRMGVFKKPTKNQTRLIKMVNVLPYYVRVSVSYVRESCLINMVGVLAHYRVAKSHSMS